MPGLPGRFRKFAHPFVMRVSLKDVDAHAIVLCGKFFVLCYPFNHRWWFKAIVVSSVSLFLHFIPFKAGID